MIVTDQFVFIHVPKTGGTFIRRMCQAHLGDRLFDHGMPNHTPDRRIPAGFEELPRFALVRNPWDWYVSWYHYQTDRMKLRRRRGPQGLFRAASDGGRNDFKGTMVNMIGDDGLDPDLMPSEDPADGMDRESKQMSVAAGRLAKMRAEDAGLLHIVYTNLCGESLDSGRIDIGKMEDLRGDFVRFLKRRRVEVPQPFIRAVQLQPPANTSPRGRFHDYYDDELRDLVAHKERAIIEAHGYTFDG